MSQDALSIRRLSEVDDALSTQLNALFDEGMTWDAEEGVAFLRDASTCFLVAFWNRQPCGFVTAYRLPRFDRRRAEVLLYEIGVHEGYRRRGVGRALIEATNRWAAEVDADEVWVLTNRSNLPATAMYRAAGGEEDDAPDITMFTYTIEPNP